MFSAQAARNAVPIVLLAVLLPGCGGGGTGGSNDAPAAASFQVATDEDKAFTDILRGSDVDGESLTYSIAAQPHHGIVALVGSTATFSYVPAADYSGTDEFTYRVNDGQKSSTGVVTVSISPVNDAPAIDAVTGPVATPPGTPVSLTVASHDVDDANTTVSAEQVVGTPVTGLVIDGNDVSFYAPTPPSAEVLQFRLKVADLHGAESVRDYSLGVFPVSASGKLHTMRGSVSAGGLHLVITGDGYAQDEQQKLIADAEAISALIVDTPDVKPYAAAWNVHVLEAVSPESGIDIDTASEHIARNTLFDADLGCGSIERAICVNMQKAQSYVDAEFPAYTQIIVIANTDRYGGSGGTIIAVSRHPDAAKIALHETGHAFAGLYDEYIVDNVVPGGVNSLNEALIPNVTAVNDPTAVKWRHWFTDPAHVPRGTNEPGVGLFEGAFSSATGLYRPTYDSFMRTLGKEMGPVNREQWIKTIYERAGTTQRLLPQMPGSSFTTPAGQTTVLTAEPRFPGQQTVRWYENGVEVAAAVNQSSYQCCTNTTGVQTVTVRISDTSGLVRAPDPGASSSEYSWHITFN